VLDRSVVVSPAAGSNEFGLRGMDREVPLEARISLPLESRIDASAGDIDVRAADGDGADALNFSEGASEVSRRGDGQTELRLIGDMSGCRATGSRAGVQGSKRGRGRRGRGKTKSSAVGTKRLRGRLRRARHAATDFSGIPITGRASRAAPRGAGVTEWIVEDRCEGTFTRVVRGTVVVTDLGRARDVVLRTGDTYLARDAVR
jgi:hypothetical protein